MKKTLLLSALLASSLTFATEYNLELTPQVGYDLVGGKIPLQNFGIVGAELQYNGFDFPIKPEASFMYSLADFETIPGYVDYADTTVIRTAINGVYEFEGFDSFTPLVKAGLGFDHMDDPHDATEQGLFLNAGAGVKIPFAETLALKLEAVYIAKNNGTTYDGNLALLAGITIPFWEKTPTVIAEEPKKAAPKKAAPAIVAAPLVVDGDDDNDGITNSKDKCPASKAGVKVDENGCFIDGDDDADGILNAADLCPNTSKNVTKVDINGCAELVNLPVTFEFDSAEVNEKNYAHVKEYVLFMNDHTDYKANIVGHTDSIGPKAYNQKLSLKRAEAVKAVIIKEGIDATRLTTEGKGESSPIASNKTKDGQAQNRRIEIEIVK